MRPVHSTEDSWWRHVLVANRVAAVLAVCAGCFAVFLILALGLALYLDHVAKSLPDLSASSNELEPARTTIVYARDNSILAEWHGEQDRTIVGYEQMPAFLRDAVVVAEDRRFYEHHGIDFQAFGSAIRSTVATDEIQTGGSTITQQVVRTLFTDGKRTPWRKVKEALTANALEARADKGKVIELYLNTVYFGKGSYGVESASKLYFGKSASALSLAEAATLAGVIESPTKFCPLENPDAARQRRNLVLDSMVESGYLTSNRAEEAKAEPLVTVPQKVAAQRAPYFTEYVKQELIDRLGAKQVYGGGLRVYTTLDPNLQLLAERAAKQLSGPNDPEVALVAVRHSDGQILAMVGGRDFSANQFNIAVQGRRQPGSAFKPFVLATALQQGIRPGTRFSASPYSVAVKDGVWNVQNYENKITAGHLTLRAATNWSVNAVYARLMMMVGPSNVVETAKKMGITTPLDPDPAIALGGLRTGVSPLEMASAFGTIANGGMAVPPSGILRVTDDTLRVVFEPSQEPVRALDRATAVQESLMLHDVVEKGTGVKAKCGAWAAGKTGTTQSYRDAWFVGWSGDVSTAVWVGNRDGQIPMTHVHGIKVTGGSFPARIWSAFMRQAIKERGAPVTPALASTPTSQILVRLCEDSLQLANSRCPHTMDIYLDPELVPKAVCTIH